MPLFPGILSAVDQIRGIAGPQGLGGRPSSLTIRRRVWSGGLRGLGTPSDTDLALPQIYDVQHLRTTEVPSSGGRYEKGDVIVGPITPSFPATALTPAGGFTEAQLNPVGGDGIEIIYILVGQHAGEYQLVELRSLEPESFYVVVRRRETTP
jgi:hypothetical protein